MGLKFRGLISESTFNTFAQLQFRSSSRALQIGEPFPSEVFDFRKKGLQLLDALREVIDGQGF